MNSWLFFSLLPPIFWGCANVLDSVTRRRFVTNDLALTWFISVTRLPVILILVALYGLPVATPSALFFMFLSGVLWMLPFVLYYKAMEFEEPSVVILILQIMPVFIYIIAYFLLGEKLTPFQWGGFALLLIGGLLAALKRMKNTWRVSKALWIMIAAGLLWAFADVLFKQYAVAFKTFWDAMTVYLFGGFVGGVAMTEIAGRGIRHYALFFRRLSARAWKFIIITQIIGFAGTIALAYAVTLGKVSLTSVIGGIQPLLVFAFAIPLSKFIPEVSPENNDKSSLALKGAAFILTIGGLLFLYYYA